MKMNMRIMHVGNAGDVIDFQDGVTATILHPYNGEHFKDTNSASVSVVLAYGNETFLLTGDLPSDQGTAFAFITPASKKYHRV
jgi:beta-lactamase superfamily II metal-dependent hydrolase